MSHRSHRTIVEAEGTSTHRAHPEGISCLNLKRIESDYMQSEALFLIMWIDVNETESSVRKHQMNER